MIIGTNMTPTVTGIRRQLKASSDPKTAAGMQKFFKTGPGEYSEGDVFMGIKVPPQRMVAKANVGLPTEQVPKLLASRIHEERSVALMIWVMQFRKGDDVKRKQIYDLYLANTCWINNWDLVDLSAPTIISWLVGRSHSPLMKLVESESMWERRIAVVGSHAFIRLGEFETTLELCRRVMNDQFDLTHKACGWMLREIYKRNADIAMRFIEENAARLPRTALRYAIERCPPEERARLMSIGSPRRRRS
jgi:3-methyladenine DNA glycosylase AlkD